MKAAIFEGPETLSIQTVPDPECGPDDIVVKVSGCGICGSDLHSYLEGAFVAPGQIMGHEFSGTVIEAGSRVEGIAVGDRVTAVPLSVCGRCPRCLEGSTHLCEIGLAASVAYGLPGAFAEFVRVPQAVRGGNVHVLPDSVDDASAAMVEPLAVALHAAKLADPLPTDTCVVIGLGSIGINTVQMLKVMGAGRIIGIDVSPTRLELARTFGADITINGRDQDPLAAVVEITGEGAYGVGARADIVIEASGVPALLGQAISMTRAAGKLRIAALYEGEPPIPANQIVQKEMSVSGTFAYKGEFSQVIDLLASGRVQASPVITHTFALDDIEQAFRTQLDKDISIKVQVTP
jgi:2-desacetyl-2-hydroxyethyl bacteriochlorophyllide A dehydrogenase